MASRPHIGRDASKKAGILRDLKNHRTMHPIGPPAGTGCNPAKRQISKVARFPVMRLSAACCTFAGSRATFAFSDMQQLQLVEAAQPGAVPSMTSLELVDFINSERKDGEAELRHDHFMAKVPKVLGEEHAPKFRDMITIMVGNGATRRSPIYRFPKREACLMAMSYSYELQAKVYDRMTALEQAITAPAPAVEQPQPPEALPGVNAIIAAVHANVMPKREGSRIIRAIALAQHPEALELLKRHPRAPRQSQPVPMPQMPLLLHELQPGPTKAPAKQTQPKPEPLRTYRLPPMGLGGCAFILDEVSDYVVGGRKALLEAMVARGFATADGNPTAKGRPLVKRRTSRGLHWHVVELLRACGGTA